MAVGGTGAVQEMCGRPGTMPCICARITDATIVGMMTVGRAERGMVCVKAVKGAREIQGTCPRRDVTSMIALEGAGRDMTHTMAVGGAGMLYLMCMGIRVAPWACIGVADGARGGATVKLHHTSTATSEQPWIGIGGETDE